MEIVVAPCPHTKHVPGRRQGGAALLSITHCKPTSMPRPHRTYVSLPPGTHMHTIPDGSGQVAVASQPCMHPAPQHSGGAHAPSRLGAPAGGLRVGKGEAPLMDVVTHTCSLSCLKLLFATPCCPRWACGGCEGQPEAAVKSLHMPSPALRRATFPTRPSPPPRPSQCWPLRLRSGLSGRLAAACALRRAGAHAWSCRCAWHRIGSDGGAANAYCVL